MSKLTDVLPQTEAITNAERQQYTKYAKDFLKPLLTKAWGVPIKVNTVASARPNPWIGARVVNYETDVVPNEFRKIVMDTLGHTPQDPDDINYGNIQRNSVTLQYNDWLKVMKAAGLHQ